MDSTACWLKCQKTGEPHLNWRLANSHQTEQRHPVVRFVIPEGKNKTGVMGSKEGDSGLQRKLNEWVDRIRGLVASIDINIS